LQFPHEIIGCVVFGDSEVADDLGAPTPGKGFGWLDVNAYEALILGHCAKQIEKLDLQFSESACAHGGQKAPALGERRGSLGASDAGLYEVRP